MEDTAGAVTHARADILALQEAVPARWRNWSNFIASLEVINKTRAFPHLPGVSTSLVDDATQPSDAAGLAAV
ncbi:hypothetical protein ACTWQF_28410 [Streptomyces sp. 8N114]|uniref:hypothetical protein n=1 Tax=Streptomyces sp. 8N114 TaxID=3457419 RepID=UPI003FD4671D